MDYGFIGLEGIAVGVPTFMYEKSQLGYYIDDILKEKSTQRLVEGDTAWGEKIMQVVNNAGKEYERASKLKDTFIKNAKVEESYERIAALFTEESTPSEGLHVDITLDDNDRLLYRQKLMDQLEALLKQHPIDKSSIVTIKKNLEEFTDAMQRYVELFDENAMRVANDDSKKVSSIINSQNLEHTVSQTYILAPLDLWSISWVYSTSTDSSQPVSMVHLPEHLNHC
ncbi:uncharacterized protein [Ptychodera flava]|uniref:uncharacterized protein n=1 Tax=Ptychodera flava TaxID=63121 RepID=UPI00396A428A